jgi:hypothetical protein
MNPHSYSTIPDDISSADIDVGDPAVIYNRDDLIGLSSQRIFDRNWEAQYPESYLKVYLKDTVSTSSALSSPLTN